MVGLDMICEGDSRENVSLVVCQLREVKTLPQVLVLE